ncbi:Sel1 repeat-containing protein [Volucribacter psittacicida]|uniref:Sel1 repeat-containing protein n=1 Tax=Volucribacter psittacicida TaxID=203482 RepID=A0A4R1FXK6_9PAST|nr:SEL1-like repeat protein [Volucribacter psittacicida]TCJ98439.1 Sel1 repeat-containing protein [Volucribacter psittacicida]
MKKSILTLSIISLLTACSSNTELAFQYYKEKNYPKAFNYYVKAAETEPNPHNHINLGYFYQNGLGTEKNIELAEYWYKQALRKYNSNLARINLGWLYIQDKAPRDCSTGLNYLFNSINQNTQYILDDLKNYFDFNGFYPLKPTNLPFGNMTQGEQLAYAGILMGKMGLGSFQDIQYLTSQYAAQNHANAIENQYIEQQNQKIYQHLLTQCQNKVW